MDLGGPLKGRVRWGKGQVLLLLHDPPGRCLLKHVLTGLLAFMVSFPFPPEEIAVASGSFPPPRPPMVHMRIS